MLLKKIKNSFSNFKSWFNKNSTSVEKKLKIFHLIQAPIFTFSILSFNFCLFKFFFIDSFMKNFDISSIYIFLFFLISSLIYLFSLFKTIKNKGNIMNYFAPSICSIILVLLYLAPIVNYPFLTKMSGLEIFLNFLAILCSISYFLNFKIMKEFNDFFKNNQSETLFKNINNDNLDNELVITLLNSDKFDKKELEINGD